VTGLKNPMKGLYACIRDFIRYPFDSVASSKAILDFRPLAKEETDQFLDTIFSRHVDCHSQQICDHIHGFFMRMGFGI
jgi:hypothetical protein